MRRELLHAAPPGFDRLSIRGTVPSGRPETGALVSTLPAPGGAEEVADPTSVQPAGGDHAVVDDDPAVPAPNRDAIEPAAGDEASQAVTVRAAGGAVQFGGVEVRKAHLDPGGRVDGVTHAQTVAVAD